MVGCKTTSHTQQASCNIDIRFVIDNSLHSKESFDTAKLHKDITQEYLTTTQSSRVIELTLIKAYVRPDSYILKATAVLSSQNENNNQLSYHRASNIDANIANLAGEYQVAITDAVFMAIEKAVKKEKQSCTALKS